MSNDNGSWRDYELTGLSKAIIAAVLLLILVAAFALCTDNPVQDAITGDDIPPPAHPTRDLSQGIATVSTDYDLDVVGEVVEECERIGLPPTLCLGVVFQEGGLVRALWPQAIGDGGESCGPLQINKIHWTPSKQCEYWFNVPRSFDLMGSRWQWAFNRHGGYGVWSANPVDFLRRFAPDAQGSIGWSTGLAQTNLSLAEGAYASWLNQPVPSGDGAPPCEVAAAIVELANQQLQVAAQIDETTYLANIARILSGTNPVGAAYTQLAARLSVHHGQVQGLAEAFLYEATLLCPPDAPSPDARRPVNAPLSQAFGITPFVQANPGLYAIPPGHSGLDFAAAHGTAIEALRGGNVIYSGWRNYYGQPVNDGTGFGITVAVSNGSDVWWYAHMSNTAVSVGQVVQAGTVLGYVGSTGKSTGPHLHFELRQNGTAVDPKPYLGWNPPLAVLPEGEEAPHD